MLPIFFGTIILVSAAHEACASYNITYLTMCIILNYCKKCYRDRSVRALTVHIGEHRRAFYQILDGKSVHLRNDDFRPGLKSKEPNSNN